MIKIKAKFFLIIINYPFLNFFKKIWKKKINWKRDRWWWINILFLNSFSNIDTDENQFIDYYLYKYIWII